MIGYKCEICDSEQEDLRILLTIIESDDNIKYSCPICFNHNCVTKIED